MPTRPFLPLSFADTIFPLRELGIDGTGTILDELGIGPSEVVIDEGRGTVTFRLRLMFAKQILLSPPGTEDLTLVLGPVEGLSELPLVLTVGNEFLVGIENLKSAIRLPSEILSPAMPGTGPRQPWRRDTEHVYEIDLPPASLTIDGAGNVRPDGTLAISLSPAFIGDTGLVLVADGIALHLDAEAPPPPGRPVGFIGLFIDDARLYLPEGFVLGEMTIAIDDAGIGSDGVFGHLSLSWSNTLTEESPHVSGSATGDLFGMPFALNEIALTLEQNIPVASLLRAEILLPFFQKVVGVTIGIASSGDLLIRLAGVARTGSDSSALADLVLHGILRFQAESAELHRTGGGVIAIAMSGSLQLLVAGIGWPQLNIEKLSIDSNGNVDFDGGWIKVPETCALDFHGVRIELDQIGFGSEGEGAAQRQWIGLSGGIRLIEGIPLTGSVNGLKVSWRTRRDDVVPYDPELRTTLEGVAVHLNIPGTLVLDGAVSYCELPRPPEIRPVRTGDAPEPVDAGGAAGVFGHVFTGSVKLDLVALKTEITGELLVGELTSYSYQPDGDHERLVLGNSYTALYIVLSAELPSALPLGTTGTGLYGINGLYAMNVAPDRRLNAEGDEEAWYEWYKADRNGSGARNITKACKWAPRSDSYAFGAGVTLGTVFDDGFTINAGMLAAILVPGPVIIIEGHADLLKPRSDSFTGAEGALYALIIFDGIAETFQMNVDINYTLKDVITVGGGLEAFFDFNDGSRWYIYVGRREPLTKRVHAEVISIISASAYFMLDPRVIQFGADAGLNLHLDYGPLDIKLIFRVTFHVELFFKEPQLGGLVEFYGEISVRVFGIGIGLVLQALLEGQAPQPWWIHGLARAAVELPWPLPDFDVKVEFSWGQDEEPARVDLLKGASMVHPKLVGASWTLPDASRAETEWPVVPVDSIPALSLAKPLSDVSLVKRDDGTSEWFRTETLQGLDLEFGYALSEIWLEERDETGSWTRRHSVPSPRGRDLRLRPDAYAREPQAEVWWFAPLDTYDKYSRRNYVDPCPLPPSPQRHCVDWRDVAIGTDFPPLFSRGELTFASGMGWSPEVVAVVPLSPGEPSRGLSVSSLSVRFPESISWVEIHWAVHGLSATAGYLAGRIVVRPRPARAGAWSDEPLGTGDPGLAIDTLELQGAPSATAAAYPAITSICWVTQREFEANQRREGSIDRSTMRGELVLRPHRSYRLHISAVRRELRNGHQAEPAQTVTYGFHTGGLPGTDYSRASGPGLSTGLPTFANGPLNNVESYVKRTVPRNGAPLFYRGYDVVVELADPYAAAMLSPVIDVVVTDRNGKSIGRPSFTFLTGDLPFITPGLLALLTAQREDQCREIPMPWTRQILPRYITCTLPEDTRPGRMYRVELVAALPYGRQNVYRLELATSQFRDAREHLGSGLVAAAEDGLGVLRGVQPLRHIGSARTPPLDWIGPVAEKLAEITALQTALAAALTVGEHDAGTTIAAATEGLPLARRTLNEWMDALYTLLDRGGELVAPWDTSRRLSYDGIHSLFVAAGLAHRPLPPRAIEALSINVGERYFILLESPEPLDWTRLIVRNAATEAVLPVVWSGDGTRAFLFDTSSSRLFSPVRQALRFSFHRGGLFAPDLDPFYRNGDLSMVEEKVVWQTNASS